MSTISESDTPDSDDRATFAELMRRVRAGDEQAAAAVYERYGEQLKRVVRIRYAYPNVQAQLDSVDVCQSVFADFILRARQGQFDLQTPGNLMALLKTMAKNRILNHLKRKREQPLDAGQHSLPVHQSPSQIVAGHELLEKANGLFTEQEQYIVQQRLSGRKWKELAAEMGEEHNALRIRHARALDRVAKALGASDLLNLD